MNAEYILVGYGGQGRVVRAALQALGHQVVGYLDKVQKANTNLTYHGAPLPPPGDAIYGPHQFAVCIGDNQTRKQLFEDLDAAHAIQAPIIHPQAFVDPSAQIEYGTYIGPKAVVHAHAKVGRGCIVNSGAIVEHDCVLEDFVHIAPGAVLCGAVVVGEGTLVGANATVLPQLRIGTWARVGAGTVLKLSLEDSSTHA